MAGKLLNKLKNIDEKEYIFYNIVKVKIYE